MTEQIISPNIFLNESDKSIIQKQPQDVGAAIIGPTVHGRPLIPTYVTTYSEFESIYGSSFTSGGYQYEYFTSIAAKEYFENGGKTLLVTKIISGSSNVNVYASSSVAAVTGSTPAFMLEALAWGDVANSSGSLSASGVLANGTENNVRWEITNVDVNKGTFGLNIRRGDDFTASKNVVESFSNLSLDPQLPNFISRVIGDQKPQYTIDSDNIGYIKTIGDFPQASEYVRVASVTPIPNSLDENGAFRAAGLTKLPTVSSGSFNGGKAATNLIPNFFEASGVSGDGNLQGVKSDDYKAALDLLSNKDEWKFNLLLVPGLTLEDSAITNTISVSTSRGDNMGILDAAKFGSTVTSVTTNASSQNSNYAAAYWPWVKVYSSNLGKSVWCPPSVVMAGVYAFNDSVSTEFFAPAGFNRGGIPSVIDTERKLSQADRDKLYGKNINPIATFPGEGIVAYGQKTLQKQATALDRINVRRCLIKIKDYLGKISRGLVFENNTMVTRNKFLNQANPYLDAIVSQEGLYAYKVVMDESNNTSDVIDRNQLVGTIQLQPSRAIEFIILNFNITPTGTDFS